MAATTGGGDTRPGAWDQGHGGVSARGKTRKGGGGGGWSGAGGRWLIWVGRVILWAFIVVVLVNGIRAPFERFTADSQGRGSADNGPASSFPTTEASAYALQFANVYLNHDEATAAEWEQQMQAFLAPGVDPRFGWNGRGRMQLQSAEVAGIDVRDANNASVTIVARAGGRQFRLAVPVYTKDGAFVISGRPAILPPLPRAALPQPAGVSRDNDLESELQEPLIGFFRAYGIGDTVALKRFADSATITSMNGALRFVALKEIVAQTGPDTQRQVRATVVWQVPPAVEQATPSVAELEQTYELTMVKKENNWYVRDIRGSTQATGP